MVEEEKIDSFNAPYYAPCMEEVKRETEKEGSFIIDRFEAFEVEWDGFASEAENGLKFLSRGQRVAKTIRAVVETMLESHFGGHIMDALFDRYGAIVQHYLSNHRTKYTNLVISFVKKWIIALLLVEKKIRSKNSEVNHDVSYLSNLCKPKVYNLYLIVLLSMEYFFFRAFCRMQ